MSRNFQCKTIPSKWLEIDGRRLDCDPYMSGAIEARELLMRHETAPLISLTTGYNDGIFNGPRFPRIYVNDPSNGVPFLGSTDILHADLSNISFLSKKQVEANTALVLNEGWTLITCSGTIGRMAYARADMAGIEPHHIAALPVPHLGTIEQQAHKLVQHAADLLTQYQKNLCDSTQLYFDSVHLKDINAGDWHQSGSDLGFSRVLKNAQSLRALNFNRECNQLVIDAYNAREKAVSLEDQARTLVEKAIKEGKRSHNCRKSQ